MKKILLFAVLLPLINAFAQLAQPASEQPVVYRPSYDSPKIEGFRRFQAIDNIADDGFYWLDSTRGDLWRLDPGLRVWVFIGSARSAGSGRNGSYQLRTDRQGGAYVLNTETGEGWCSDGNTWKSIGHPSSQPK